MSLLQFQDITAQQLGSASTVLEDWMGVDATPIVNGRFEKPAFIARG